MRLEIEVVRNDVRQLEETIETTGARERLLAQRIEVLEEEIAKLEAHSRKREIFYQTDRVELIRKYDLEIVDLQD